MKKRLLRLLTGLSVALAVLIFGVVILSRALAWHQTLYHGNPGDYWIAQINGPDAAASNQADAILNAEIIPHLTEVMMHDNEDPALKLALVKELNSLPGVSIPFVPARDRRKGAARELGEYGPAARAAVPVLLQALNGGDDAVRESAAISLGSIHAEPEVVIPALIACLGEDDVNESVVTALAEFGAQARPAVPRILPLLHSYDGETQWAAAGALRKIDPDAYARATSTNSNAVTNEVGATGAK
jgi:hypothetical protein